MKKAKEFIKDENKLKKENDARLLADLIYLNCEHSNGQPNKYYMILLIIQKKKKIFENILYLKVDVTWY